MLKEKKEKNLIAAIMKFLRDKLKELIKKIFARDLSFDQRLDKEIKELQEKLGSGELSEEEFARALERLTALQDLKLRLQMAVVGWIVTMFAEMFGVELAAAVEASTEKEDKKAEKTSLKEENKEVCENVEMKVDEREKPKVPVSIFEVSPGFVRPVVLSKPELDLLPESIMPPIPKEVISNEDSKVQKPKVNEAKPGEPEKEVYPPKVPKQTPATNRMKFDFGPAKDIGSEKRRSSNINGRETTPSTNEQGNNNKEKESRSASCAESRLNGGVNKKSTNEQDDLDARLTKKIAERNARRKESAIKHDYPIDTWQAPSGTNNRNPSAAQQSPASNAQAKVSSELTGPKANNLVEGQSVGKTPS